MARRLAGDAPCWCEHVLRIGELRIFDKMADATHGPGLGSRAATATKDAYSRLQRARLAHRCARVARR